MLSVGRARTWMKASVEVKRKHLISKKLKKKCLQLFCVEVEQVEALSHRMGVLCWNWRERPTQPSCMMLNMTHRGQHCRLYNVIQMEANPSCVMLNVTQTGKHCPLVWCSIWLTEANIAILCEAEVDTGENTVVLYHDVAQRGKLCHLVWYWRRCQVCYWCYWCIIEDSRKRQHHHRHLKH